MAVVSNVVKGAAVPAPQSTTSSAWMVVESSKVVAVKFGDDTPNEPGSPETTTGALTIEFVRSSAPVATAYWVGSAPLPSKLKPLTERPPREVRFRVNAPTP